MARDDIHGNGMVTILVPSAPSASNGPVKIVDQNRVQMLDTNLAGCTTILGHWGVGTSKMAVKKNSTT